MGPSLTLFAGPGGAVGDEPRDTGAGGRAAGGRGLLQAAPGVPPFPFEAPATRV